MHARAVIPYTAKRGSRPNLLTVSPPRVFSLHQTTRCRAVALKLADAETGDGFRFRPYLAKEPPGLVANSVSLTFEVEANP